MAVEVRVRRNIDDVAADPVELGNYLHAFQKLIEISDIDPESRDGYLFFEALHDDIEVGPCEHGRDTFLPWHRAHLFMFEEALRRSDPPRTSKVTVPYWDWSKLPSGSRYPKAFEDTTSVLHHADRIDDPICRGGEGPGSGCARLPFPRQWLEDNVLRISRWSGVDGFAGEAAGKSSCVSHSRQGYGKLESPPHNTMHDSYVGGDMANPSLAARDPIFWSFHAYIDLLWAQWQEMPGHTVDTCLNCRLCGLFKDAPLTERYRVRDVLDTVTQLAVSYEYTRELPPEPEMLTESRLRLFPSHPAVDFVMTARRPALQVRTLDLTIPRPGFSSARLRVSGVRLRNPFSYEGDLYLAPSGEPFAPQDLAFRERYLVDLFFIWMIHSHGHASGHGGHGGHGGHAHEPEESEMDVVTDLTPHLTSLAASHAGEKWTLTIALAIDTGDEPDLAAFERRVLPAGRSLPDFMGFREMELEID